ncbi:hypothetical protein diail_8774 [Diaporthe ilicicola]|nr:hypothetical protein diail_8774 [Diaporthe ilicicola]
MGVNNTRGPDSASAQESLDSEAILRVTSYHRRDWDYAVISAAPGQHDGVRASLFGVSGSFGGSDLGSLQRLPLELISAICLLLDIRSALAFSQANRRSREVTSSIRQYRQLSEHALHCMWALFRTGLAAYTGVTTLHALLSTDRCAICDSFGGFVFLPTASRCCFDCIESATATRVVPLSDVSKAAGVSVAKLKKAYPVSRSLPGIYSLRTKHHKRRRNLLSENQALEILQQTVRGDPQTILEKLPDALSWRHMMSTWLPFVSSAADHPQLGRSCKGCQVAMETGGGMDAFFRRERSFSDDEFLVHFRDCGEAEQLWHSSKGGTVEVEEPEWTRLGALLIMEE